MKMFLLGLWILINADPDVLTFDESNSNQSVDSCLGYSQQTDLYSVHPEPVCEHL